MTELARSRAASLPLMKALATVMAPSAQVKKAPVVPAVAVVPPATPELLYNADGRVVFNLHIPADLSHLSNDTVRQAIRVQVCCRCILCNVLQKSHDRFYLQTAHATLITTHVALLRRLLRCVTALAMSQVLTM